MLRGSAKLPNSFSTRPGANWAKAAVATATTAIATAIASPQGQPFGSGISGRPTGFVSSASAISVCFLIASRARSAT
jgi:hypothetical protein